MLPRPPATAWWVFRPIAGIDLTGDNPNLFNNPLFGDALLINQADLLRYLDEVKSDSRIADHHGSYLGICQSGVLNTKWFDEEHSNEHFMLQAAIRQQQIAGFLSIMGLIQPNDVYQCGLTYDFIRQKDHFVLYNIHEEDWLSSRANGISLETFTCSANYDILEWSYSQFETFCTNNEINKLFQYMHSNAQNPIQITLRQAVARLYKAIMATTYTDQLLGAITTLEILLTNDHSRTPYKKIKERIRTILGSELTTRYALETVFESRNHYVHRGTDLVERTIPLQAVGLAIATILRYADACIDYKTKDQLLNDLDRRLQTTRTNTSRQKQLYYLLDQPYSIALFKYIDKTLEFDCEFNKGLYDRTDRIFEPENSFDD
ncbi:MAG TPA: hypothetical protein DEF47_00970 [Herpetosiphon sp.]|uniref:Apea-like HEPN domain-containing protein n=1 Tax=Herpetosiphon aurantiacus (strain ATCC 23779 / DSM 785 / 114-95) TaxID=316274 RepID=A9B3B8_HERA2|nr:hypothetical protein [Herpetosiphon sp.]ABX04081.1 hypothetical protein Haur_1437 [Herpetosiphon aurantiacus DSM 785]HBW48459.1 hypothetical protein [Herpetosiphon sp.]